MIRRQAEVLIILVFLAGLFWWSLQDPLVADPDDCAARGKAADCWQDHR